MASRSRSSSPSSSMARRKSEDSASSLSSSFVVHNRSSLEFCNYDQKLASVKLDFNNVKLYGRENEIKELKAASDRVRERGSKEVVLVYGYSGVGKSSLVGTLREDHGAHLITGKFDEKIRAGEPFGPIVDTISELSEIVLASSKVDTIKRSLKEVFQDKQDEMEAFWSLFPSAYDELLGARKSPHNAEKTTNKQQDMWARGFTKLKVACCRFFRVVCDNLDRLVVLFIDDLQWGDASSLELIKTIAADNEMHNLLFIGAYRDNEVDSIHPLTMQLRKLESQGSVTISRIQLGDLDTLSVQKIVADCLHSSCLKPVKSLSDVVYTKTHGNAFFVIQFLRLLHEDGFLFYSTKNYDWECDLGRILAETAISDNIVDFMTSKIQKLPKDVVSVLKVAACLGRKFNVSQVEKVVNRLKEETKWEQDFAISSEIMDAAVEGGILNPPKTPDIFTFAHDRIQQAAYSLFLPDALARTKAHLCIGRLLRTKAEACCESSVRDRISLAAAEQLNLGAELITDQFERRKLVQLNAKAARLASAKSSFFASRTFLESGLSLMDVNHKWQTNYDLTLQMTTLLAKMQYSTGSISESKKNIQEVLQNGKSMSDKLPVYILEIESLGAAGECAIVIEVAVGILDQLGESIPSKPTNRQVAAESRAVQSLLKGRSNDELLKIPNVTDDRKRSAMEVIRLLRMNAIWIGSKNFLKMVDLRAIKLVLVYGANKCTANAWANFGYVQSETCWDEGFRFGELSVLFMERFADDKDVQAEALFHNHIYLHHLKRPIHESLDPMFKAYQLGMEAGDIKQAAAAAFMYLEMYFWCGLSLAPVMQDAKGFRDEMTRYNQHGWKSKIAMQYQIILNLTGKAEDPLRLVGESIDADELMKSSLESGNHYNAQSIRFMHLVLAYHLGDPEEAWKRAEEFMAKDSDGWGVEFMTGPYCFFLGLAGLAALKIRCSRKIKHKSRKYTQKVEEWSNKGEVNAKHLHLILLAEKTCIKQGEFDDVKKAYDAAITSASRGGFLANAGLACERAGEYLISQGQHGWAEDYLMRSYQFYEGWGAAAKLNQLRSKYQFLEAYSSLTKVGTHRFGVERYDGKIEKMHNKRGLLESMVESTNSTD